MEWNVGGSYICVLEDLLKLMMLMPSSDAEPRPCRTMIMCTCSEILRSLGHIPGRSRGFEERCGSFARHIFVPHYYYDIIMITIASIIDSILIGCIVIVHI